MNRTSIARHAFLATAASFEAPVETGSTVIEYDGNEAAKVAILMAGKEDAGMSAAIGEVVKAKEDWQGGPFKVLIALKNTYGDDLDSWPKPGSDTGNVRDVITVDEIVDGVTKAKKTTWYAVFADNTKEGKAVLDGLNYIERAGKADAIKDGIPADIIAMTPHQRANHKNFLLGRRSTIRGCYKRAVQLNHQLNAVNNLAEVTAEPIWMDGKEGEEVVNTTKPIQVFTPSKTGGFPTQYDTYSVANFLKMDAKKASEKGGTFKALQATLERGTKGETNKTAAEKLVIKTVPTFVEVLATMHGYLDGVAFDKTQADMGQIAKLLNTKDSDELVSAVVEVRNVLNDIIEASSLESKYAKVQARLAKHAA